MSRFQQDFATNQSLGPMAADFGRAGDQWASNAAGTALVKYGRTPNAVKYTDDLNTGSVKRGTATVTVQGKAWNRGTGWMSQLNGLGGRGVDDVYFSDVVTNATSGADVGAALWVDPGAATGVLAFANAQQSETGGQWLIDLSALSAGPQRVTASHPAVTVVSAFTVYTNGKAGWHFWEAGGAVDGVFVAGIQMHPGVTGSPDVDYFHAGDNAAPAFDGMRGVALGALATNDCQDSDDLSGVGWSAQGTGSPALDAVAVNSFGETGAWYAEGLSDGINRHRHITQNGGGWTVGQDVAVGVMFKLRSSALSGGRQVRISNAFSGVSGGWDVDTAQLPENAYVFLTAAHPAVTVTAPMVVHTDGNFGLSIGTTSTGAGSYSAYFEGVTIVRGQAFPPMAPIRTNGATAARQPTTLTSALSALGVDEVTNDLDFHVVVRPSFSSAEGAGQYMRALVLHDGSAANLVRVYFAPSGTLLWMQVVSASSVVSNIAVDLAAWNRDSEIQIAGNMTTSGGAFRARVDGGSWVSTTTAYNSGVSSAFTHVNLGHSSVTADRHFTGVIPGLELRTGADVRSDAVLATLTADDLKAVPLTIKSGATSGAVTVIAPDVAELRPGGSLNHVPYNTNREVMLRSGNESVFGGHVQLIPAIESNVGVISTLGPNAPAGAQVGETRTAHNIAGRVTIDPETGAVTVAEYEGGVATYAELVYHDGAWIEGSQVTVDEPAGGGQPGKLAISMAIGL